MILLDTHAWIWWVTDPERLSPGATAAIEREIERGQILVSAISCWELTLLVRKGRLALNLDAADWIAASEALPYLRFAPVDHRIAMQANLLRGALHDDPADRFLIATAIILGATLVTRDERIRAYPHVTSLW